MKFVICPGAQKAGTTTLYELLESHPQIALAKKKETKYFLKSPNDISEEDFIEQHFILSENSKVLGDIDPEYFYYPDIAEKIFKVLGKSVKFIFMLRNPVDRAYSHYWMSYRRGFEQESFENAIKLEANRLKTGTVKAIWHYSYVDRGYYYKQIKRYLEFYPKEQMMFIIFEKFIKNQQKHLNDILEFLGVDDINNDIINRVRANEGVLPKWQWLSRLHGQPYAFKKVLRILVPVRKWRWWVYPIIEKYNISSDKPPAVAVVTKQKVIKKYKSDIQHLEKLINTDLSDWLKT